jgi:FkbM family methyltransferase
MRRLLQDALLALYRAVFAQGLLKFGWGRRLFFGLYDIYKEWLEAGEIDLLRVWIPSGGTVVDVGSNVGFFALRFAEWVGSHGRVVAIEPEQKNYEELTRRLAARGYASRVVPYHAVADRVSGQVMLDVNPDHPGDHKIGTQGIPVQARKLDELVSDLPRPVCLIKIDVQGAEQRVLEGATEILRMDKPALFIEIDPRGLQRFDTTTDRLFDYLAGFGYLPHQVTSTGAVALTAEVLDRALSQTGYTDVLFLHESSGSGGASRHERESVVISP